MSDDNGKVSNLHQPTHLITSHNDAGKAIVHTNQPFQWQPFDNSKMAFSVLYTTSEFPPDLNNETDIHSYKSVLDGGKLGLVNPGGSVLRCVDFAPGYSCAMHRTQSLDYGIVMEGEVDMVLDSGEVHHMKKGDVAVQRATQHQWVNRSETEWVRMIFVLQDVKPLVIGGKDYGEDLGKDGSLPATTRE